jgi:hypothetical protein
MDSIGANPGKSIMPDWKALERIAKHAAFCIKTMGAPGFHTDFELLKAAVRDYEVLKHDAT